MLGAAVSPVHHCPSPSRQDMTHQANVNSVDQSFSLIKAHFYTDWSRDSRRSIINSGSRSIEGDSVLLFFSIRIDNSHVLSVNDVFNVCNNLSSIKI